MYRNLISAFQHPQRLVRRGESLFAYYALNGYAPPPSNVAMYLTYKCNLRCKMCWWWGKSGVQPSSDELSTSQILHFLSQVKGFKPLITISGGEPLTRTDLPEILTYIKTSNLSVELLTNGTLITEKTANVLVQSVDSLIFSIDGPAFVHDLIRGKGSFDKTISGIRLVQNLSKQSGKRVNVRINCVISELNLFCLDDLVAIAASLNCSLSFGHLMFTSEKIAEDQSKAMNSKLKIKSDTINGFITGLNAKKEAKLIQQLNACNLKASRHNVPLNIAPILKDDASVCQWYSGITPISGMHCTYHWTTMFMKPDGEIVPCDFINFSVGNITKQTPLSIWNSNRARYFRKLLKKGMFPGCVRCCRLTPAPWL
jgi:MoaA/NifB/PqqE/SkfB family radical SAM enzyme